MMGGTDSRKDLLGRSPVPETPCMGDPERWFSDSPFLVESAKKACTKCPIVAECRDLGRGEEFGVWGGLSEVDRAREGRAVDAGSRLERVERVAELLGRGASISQIAAAEGIPKSTARGYIQRALEAGAVRGPAVAQGVSGAA